MVDTLVAFPENTVVLDGTGRRWSYESWCSSDMVCALRWVGPGLRSLTATELAARGPISVLRVPGEGHIVRCFLAEGLV